MTIMAIVILLIEAIQISFDPFSYLSSPFNYLDLAGNSLVLLTRFERFKDLNWIMIFLIL